MTLTNKLLQRFEQVLEKRNPLLAELLQPGLSEPEIRKLLQRVGFRADMEPIIALYSWRNGTRPTSGHTLEELSPFPKSSFCFEELDLMLAHFRAFEEYAANNPDFAVAVRRCFPMFWDSSSRWMAIDLKPSMDGRIVLFDSECPPPLTELYKSFDGFLNDAIKANEKNDSLACFQDR